MGEITGAQQRNGTIFQRRLLTSQSSQSKINLHGSESRPAWLAGSAREPEG